MSCYKIETWLKRGYSHDEAKYQIRIRRPNNVDYYQNKYNCSIEDAELHLHEFQVNGGKMSASRPIHEIRESSVRCIEFYLKKGMNEDEAKLALSEVQATFSLEKCINKYGEDDGIRVWKERQDKWQSTLNTKTEKEKIDINEKKKFGYHNFLKKYGKDLAPEKFEQHCKNNNKQFFSKINEIEMYLKSKSMPTDYYLTAIQFYKKFIKGYYWSLVKKPEDIVDWLNSFIEFKEWTSTNYTNTSEIWDKGRYYFNVENGKILRSIDEKYFYELLKLNNLKYGEDFYIEKHYDCSKLRCDFYLVKSKQYIEIVGQGDYKYYQNIQYKKETYQSILLHNSKEIAEFLNLFMKEHYNESNH